MRAAGLKNQFFQYYSAHYNPDASWKTVGVFNFIMAMLTLTHWVTYYFMLRSFIAGLNVIIDMAFKTWQEEQVAHIRTQLATPEFQVLLHSDLYERVTTYQQANMLSSQCVTQMQLFLGCVHLGWFKEAASIHKNLEEWTKS